MANATKYVPALIALGVAAPAPGIELIEFNDPANLLHRALVRTPHAANFGELTALVMTIARRSFAEKARHDAYMSMIRQDLLPLETNSRALLKQLVQAATDGKLDGFPKLKELLAAKSDKLTTRQLIKRLGTPAMSIVAASGYSPTVVRILLSGYMVDGEFGNALTACLTDIREEHKSLSVGTLIVNEMARMGIDPDAYAQGHPQYSLLMQIANGGKPYTPPAPKAAAPAPAPAAAPADEPAGNNDTTTTQQDTEDTMATKTPSITNRIIVGGVGSKPSVTADDIANHPAGQPAQAEPQHTASTLPPMPQAKPSAAFTSAIPDALVAPINGLLVAAGVNFDIGGLLAQVALADDLKTVAEAHRKETEKLTLEVKRLAARSPVVMQAQASMNGALPNGTCDTKPVASVFPELQAAKLDVPMWTWDAPHPDVPAIDPDYVFRKPMLVRALRCLLKGENLWLQGHTGSGKTTFIEQVCARLNWPVARIAFDSALDRSELVGRMSLKADGKGGTISEWLPGVLERALPNGYVLLCDEFDAGRPDALYTLQPVLEGKGLRLLEDGDRRIHAHPMSRIVATGNTAGNGDSSGLYPACRTLSAATLDRFAEFLMVPYMTVEEESVLLRKRVPTLTRVRATKLAKFGEEMRAAFIRNELPISYSPRRSVAFAAAVEDYVDMHSSIDEEAAMSMAFKGKLFDAAPAEFQQRLHEIAKATLGNITVTPTLPF